MTTTRLTPARLLIIARGLWINLSRGWRDVAPRSFARWASDAFLYRVLSVADIGHDRVRTLRFRDGAVVTYRLNRGDIRAVAETWMTRAYELPVPVGQPQLLLDLGANIGLTSCWLARRYGCREVVAVEPVPANAALARRNLAANGIAATVFEAAVGARSGTAFFADHRESTEGRVAAQGRAVRMLTVDELVGDRRIDVLKMDIEGAEGDVLAARAPWLDRVGLIVAELHPDHADVEQVLACLREAGFEQHHIPGESFGPRGTEFMACFTRTPAAGSPPNGARSHPS